MVDAIQKADWTRARHLLHLRVQMRLAPTKDERASIHRILTLIDEAEENGTGPNPQLRNRPLGPSTADRKFVPD